MAITFEQARDNMQAQFNVAWLANSPAVVGGTAPPVIWDNDEDASPPPQGTRYVRFNLQHQDGGQRTLGGPGARRFSRLGLITASIFVLHNEGLAIASKLAKIITDAFEGTTDVSGEITYLNIRPNEVGPTLTWFQMDVFIEFDYDDIK